MVEEVYLDSHTVSKPSLAVLRRMAYFHADKWGILTAPHRKGLELYDEIDRAQKQLYTSLGITDSFVFDLTSGGVSGGMEFLINFYLHEIIETGRNHLLAPEMDAASILLPMKRLEKLGCVRHLLPVDREGKLNLTELEIYLKPRTSLLSLSWVNGLTGVVQPLEPLIELCHRKGVKVHLSLNHAIGNLSVDIASSVLGKVDFLSFDGDKINTPQGIGALFVREKKDFFSTLYPDKFCSLALAVEEAVVYQEQTAIETARLRERFESELQRRLVGVVVPFQSAYRVPHISTLCFTGVMCEALLFRLNRSNLYASIGGGLYPHLSAWLKCCGFPDEWVFSAVSFSFVQTMTDEVLDKAIDIITEAVHQLRKIGYPT